MNRKVAVAAAENVKNTKDFIYMTACGLKNVTPEESRIAEMNLGAVMNIALHHMMGAMVAQAFVRTDTFKKMPEERQEKWETICYSAVRKQVFFRKESARVFKALDDAGIWYCPIKGMSTADCYPIPGVREMTDCDVLVDGDKGAEIRDLMKGLGYETELYGESKHDVYHKKPLYNFEMHRMLFSPDGIPACVRYYADIKDRLVKDEGNRCGFHFSDEEAYIFNVVHTYKHYSLSGTGMKSLTDVYMIRHHFPDMDEEYLARAFRALEIEDLERTLRETAEILFDRPDNIYRVELSKEQKELLTYILGSGAFGTAENDMRNRLKRLGGEEKVSMRTKIRYLVERLYPHGALYEEKYAFFFRHKWAYPFLPIYRAVSRGSVKSIITEIKRAMKS